MTRNQAEKQIASHLEQISKIAEEYGCETGLHMYAEPSGHISAFNAYWKEKRKTINFHRLEGEKTI